MDVYLKEELYDILTYYNRILMTQILNKKRMEEIGKELYDDGSTDVWKICFIQLNLG